MARDGTSELELSRQDPEASERETEDDDGGDETEGLLGTGASPSRNGLGKANLSLTETVSKAGQEAKDNSQEIRESAWWTAGQFIFAFLGLQANYILWGYQQEKIMTTPYGTEGEKFPSTNFVVMSNRFLALLIGSLVTLIRKHRLEFAGAPLNSFAPCAFSNTLSSYGSYQALNYVSFPLQTLAKSTKIIPVMMMGMLLNGKVYQCVEYAEAFLISFGVSLFMIKGELGARAHEDRETEIIGVLFLVLYVVTDSFTSQWQSRIYQSYPKVDQFQMMLGVNLWALIFSTGMWILMGEAGQTISFLSRYPNSIGDNVIISVTSACGQLFIFFTIKTFGPVAFTIIMTTRQIFSLFLSMSIFSHPISPFGWFGIAVVFSTLFWQVYRKQKAQISVGHGSGKR